MLCNFGGQPIFGRIQKRPSRLTRSNALVKSMKGVYKGICSSLHFSRSWRREKTMSIVDLQLGSRTAIQDKHVLPASAAKSR